MSAPPAVRRLLGAAARTEEQKRERHYVSVLTHARREVFFPCMFRHRRVGQVAAYLNSKWPPGSWKLPAPNDPFLFPRRTQPGCLLLVTTTPTPTPGRRARCSALAVIAPGEGAGGSSEGRSPHPQGHHQSLSNWRRLQKSKREPLCLARLALVHGVCVSSRVFCLWNVMFALERLRVKAFVFTNTLYCCTFDITLKFFQPIHLFTCFHAPAPYSFFLHHRTFILTVAQMSLVPGQR